MEHPVAIYCDFETVNRKLLGCEPDPKSSYTNMQTLQEASGFTYTVVSPYFPNQVKTYRGEDAGEVFLRNILEEEKNVFKILEEIEMVNHNLSPEEERQWQAETKCHICKERFYSKPPETKNNHKQDLALKCSAWKVFGIKYFGLVGL